MNMQDDRRRWATGQEEPLGLPQPTAGGQTCEAKAPGNGEAYGRGLGDGIDHTGRTDRDGTIGVGEASPRVENSVAVGRAAHG